MKHLWQMLAVGFAAFGAACADGMTRPSPEPSSVPATIAVPSILGSAGGKFQFNADGSRQYIQDGPGDGSGNCYDVCDAPPDGGGGGTGSGGDDGDARFQGPYFTEAMFDPDVLKGHAEMSFVVADHATQDMTLSTWRPDGSVIGSQKYSTGQTWPLPVLTVHTMTTDGAMPAPHCGARGQGTTAHEVSSLLRGYPFGQKATSFSTVMTQAPCTSTQQTTQTAVTSTAGGVLRICLREDHYSASGQYIDTTTLYCYYTNAT